MLFSSGMDADGEGSEIIIEVVRFRITLSLITLPDSHPVPLVRG